MGIVDKPLSRKDDLVVQELNGEILIYDLRENKAFCLNETSALVWQACDGTRSVAEIGHNVGGEDNVWLALDELKKERLIENESVPPSKFDGMSRRDVIKKIGIGSMIALPLVSSLIAPPAAFAASSCVVGAGTCTCQGPNGGTGNVCTPATSTCNPGCVCRFTNNGNLNGICAA